VHKRGAREAGVGAAETRDMQVPRRREVKVATENCIFGKEVRTVFREYWWVFVKDIVRHKAW